MRPAPRLLSLLALWLLLALGLNLAAWLLPQYLSTLQWLWWGLGAALLLAACFDAQHSAELKRLNSRRQIPANLSLGVATPVELILDNPLSRPVRLAVLERPDEAIDSGGLQIAALPQTLLLPAAENTSLGYSLTARRRGDTGLGTTLLRADSRWSLWQRKLSVGEPSALKVYPNFNALALSADLGVEQQLRDLGIHLSQRRGDGMEFKQLREFQQGDALRQVDWKATARQRRPISREYQQERDQEIIFMLDCGRRLRHQDEGLSHFDCALNALLLTATMALRQGDGVGVMSFAGDSRWLAPVNSGAGIGQLLSQLYDLQSSNRNSDFLQAAEQLMSRHRKRALLIVISNIRDEDRDDLIAAHQLLRKQHRVVVASLREDFLDDSLERPIENFNDAIGYAGNQHYLEQRGQLMKNLRGAGLSLIDSSPQDLHRQLLAEYFRLKRSNSL